jgi:LAS superfamily LD-carboxypeptidase LdcB
MAPPARPERRHQAGVGTAGDELPDGVTVFNNTYPAITRLNPALRFALRAAAKDAAADGVQFHVSSGWRSKKFQERLFDQAVAKYGSVDVAARWVARPGTSVHESGDAVDLGPGGADAWLSRHGAAHGLCQIYQNEPWHYELRPKAPKDGCPAMYANPSDDPRLK